MKKTYETPTLIVGGNVVDETLSGTVPSGENQAQTILLPPMFGGVGYYL